MKLDYNYIINMWHEYERNELVNYYNLVACIGKVSSSIALKNIVMKKLNKEIKNLVNNKQLESAWNNYIKTGNTDKILETLEKERFSSRFGKNANSSFFYQKICEKIIEKKEYQLLELISLDNKDLIYLINSAFPNNFFEALYG